MVTINVSRRPHLSARLPKMALPTGLAIKVSGNIWL